ncbi:putative membrane protein [Burkholderia thailandensis 34]|uniref:hypothetical protein n=1 Tax=Burkholderia thailandensis TaxID=57975 RepID=UPI0005D83754|nr:hypothetical protein [Burkholderia thailandensis]AJY32449.1 putative membrane protein [Burkholderia thailandensis 34]
MNFEIGIICITLGSMFVTWLMFGAKKEESRKRKFLYWLKSTAFLWMALILWVSYMEPNISLAVSAGVSLAFSALANLLRSQWVFMLP